MKWIVLCCLSLPTLGFSADKPVIIRDSVRHSLASKILGETLEIDVFLPRGYKKNQRRHPVLYVTDAEYNFGAVSYIVRRLIKNRDIPEIIVVGIAYDTHYEDFYRKRARDLTPFKKSTPKLPHTGGADRFANFLQKEVFSFVDSHYRTRKTDRALYGHSFGGLFGLYVMFTRPTLFQRILSLSPSLWFGNRQIFRVEKQAAEAGRTLPVHLYTAVGGQEPTYFVADWKKLTETMKKRGFRGLQLSDEVLIQENHRSIFGSAFTTGLRKLFAQAGADTRTDLTP